EAGQVPEAFSKLPGPRMVRCQFFRHRFEGDEPGGSQDARLAHAAAKQLADAVRPGDEPFRAEQDRADRGAESFAEADGRTVEAGADGGDVSAEGDCGIEAPGGVQVDRQAVAPAESG